MPNRPFTVAVVAVFVVAACGDRPRPQDTTGEGPTTTAGATEWPLYLIPSRLPDGVRIQSTSVTDHGHEGEGWTALVGRKDGEGHKDVVHAHVTGAAGDREVSPDEAEGITYVDVNGRRARLASHEVVGTGLDFFDDGRTLGVIGPVGKKDDVVAIARAIRLPDEGAAATTIGALPAGYEVIGEYSTRGFPRRDYTISVIGGEGKAGHISVSLVPDEGDPTVMLAIGDSLSRRLVRGGHQGWLGARSRQAPGVTITQHSVAWKERPDVTVAVAGNFTEAEVLLIAEGLKETDEATWRATVKPR